MSGTDDLGDLSGTDQPDAVVVKALRDLPVPEHRLTFWDDLDAAIRDAGAAEAVDGHTTVDHLPPRLDTSEVPVLHRDEPRRPAARRAAPWLAVAAGLLVVAGAARVVLGGGGDDDGSDVADGTDTTQVEVASSPDTTVSTTLASPTTTTTAPTPSPAEPADVARQFIDALGEGDTEVALSLLGPRSVAYIESLGGDPLGYVSEMQEGYGAWAGAPDLELTATSAGVVEPLTSELSIVTVEGTHPGEGEPAPRVDAFPLVRQGDSWVVELVALVDGRDNRLRFTVPRLDEDTGALGPMAPNGEVNVFVPAQGTVLYQLDGGEIFPDPTADIPAGIFSLHAPASPLAAGPHVLVVVAVGQDGSITPFAGSFVVEG